MGVLFVIYPFSQFMKSREAGSQESSSWMFALFFFILYAVSAIANGLRELQDKPPSFSLLRFFEVTLNSFVAVYLLILLFVLKLNSVSFSLLLILIIVIAISAIRDMRYLSLQYYEKKQMLQQKRKK